MKQFIVSMLALVVFLAVAFSAFGEENRTGKVKRESPKIIIMKPKFVEGEVGKPAIIIIPRASLLNNSLFDKSYHNDILRDLYLGTTKDISKIKE